MTAYEHRTAITRVSLDDDQHDLLLETVTEWRRACQIAVNAAWGVCSSASAVQSLTYDRIRERTTLGSQHTILATRQAAAAIRASHEQDGGKPQFTAPTITYDKRSMTVFDDWSVSLATVDGRVECELALPEDEDGYQYTYLRSDDWELTESTLTLCDGSVSLHLGFRRPAVSTEGWTENGTVLGVDLGIEQLAVTSTARFFSGSELRHRHDQFERIRASLPRCATRSAHRTLTRIGGRERRHTTCILHRVANGIFEEALRYDCSTIAIENLAGIRDRLPNAGWFHRWAFARLVTYVEYKARSEALAVVRVDPANTSRRCADCEYVADENRPSRSQLECKNCGNRSHADYNAAKNIGFRAVRRDHQSSRRTGTGHCALKSGTVTPDGAFVPYSDEFTDNSDLTA